jgi:hypothetical protein
MKNILTLAVVCFSTLLVFAGDHSKKVIGPKAIDPDDAYKNNCMRCHSAVRQYSPRMTATIVKHMRVRANLTAEETRAILQYLNENEPAKSTRASASGVKEQIRK